jgi:hypothetical protein
LQVTTGYHYVHLFSPFILPENLSPYCHILERYSACIYLLRKTVYLKEMLKKSTSLESPVPEKSPFNYTPPAAVAGCHALVMGIPCGLDGGKAYESMDDSSGYPLVI